MPNPQIPAKARANMVRRWRPIIRGLLTETRQQGRHTSWGPTLHGQRARLFDIDALARSQGYAMIARSPSDSDPPIDDKDRSLFFSDINCPLRAAHPGDRLRCNV